MKDKTSSKCRWTVFHKCYEGQNTEKKDSKCPSFQLWRTICLVKSQEVSFIPPMKDKSTRKKNQSVYHKRYEGQNIKGKLLNCLSWELWRTNRQGNQSEMSIIPWWSPTSKKNNELRASPNIYLLLSPKKEQIRPCDYQNNRPQWCEIQTFILKNAKPFHKFVIK